MMEKEHNHVIVPYGTYVSVWLTLVIFTVLTVSIAGFNLGTLTVAVALVIAATKATIVFDVFMHLKYDKPHFKVMLAVSLFTLLFMFIVFFDISNR